MLLIRHQLLPEGNPHFDLETFFRESADGETCLRAIKNPQSTSGIVEADPHVLRLRHRIGRAIVVYHVNTEPVRVPECRDLNFAGSGPPRHAVFDSVLDQWLQQ